MERKPFGRKGVIQAKAEDVQPSGAAAPTVQPTPTAKLLDALPGLIGAIDRTIFEQTGKKFPFVLLAFGDGGALHATNFDAKVALKAVQEFADATRGDVE